VLQLQDAATVDASSGADRLGAYVDLLEDVAVPRGFIASGDQGRLVDRHVLDALRAAGALRHAATIADLGSGAGLPGVPLAIVRPDARFTLIESRRQRGAFLELAVERLGLDNVEVSLARVEDLRRTSFDAATARAFAPVDRAWELGHRLLVDGGCLVVFAGRDAMVPRELVGASSVVSQPPLLASQGPLIIISR
jgi:16S rRNA (guanine527-N7)-methyltransferase